VEIAKRNPSKFWKGFKKRLQRVGVKGKAEWYAYFIKGFMRERHLKGGAVINGGRKR
jgi:hypothetical protein